MLGFTPGRSVSGSGVFRETQISYYYVHEIC